MYDNFVGIWRQFVLGHLITLVNTLLLKYQNQQCQQLGGDAHIRGFLSVFIEQKKYFNAKIFGSNSNPNGLKFALERSYFITMDRVQ